MAVLLVIALALVAWLAYEAVDAARSHRRTAEGVLRDYALVSATQLALVVGERLDDVIDRVLVSVLSQSRRRGAASPAGHREADGRRGASRL